MAHRSVLDRIVEERVGQTFVASVSAVIDRLAEDIAREALSDRTFRRSIRELVRSRSKELLDKLFRNGKPRQRRVSSPPRRGARRRGRSRA